MSIRVRQVERYGKTVWEQPAADEMRRDLCMCLHCERLKPGLPDNCDIAEAIFGLCQSRGIATAMTRCAEFVAKADVQQ